MLAIAIMERMRRAAMPSQIRNQNPARPTAPEFLQQRTPYQSVCRQPVQEQEDRFAASDSLTVKIHFRLRTSDPTRA
jgi:hypothetical protein